METLTVEELIRELQKVKDKKTPVFVWNDHPFNSSRMRYIKDVDSLTEDDGYEKHVSINLR